MFINKLVLLVLIFITLQGCSFLEINKVVIPFKGEGWLIKDDPKGALFSWGFSSANGSDVTASFKCNNVELTLYSAHLRRGGAIGIPFIPLVPGSQNKNGYFLVEVKSEKEKNLVCPSIETTTSETSGSHRIYLKKAWSPPSSKDNSKFCGFITPDSIRSVDSLNYKVHYKNCVSNTLELRKRNDIYYCPLCGLPT